ncbi:MAG TPA: VWA domain-containing protein [Gemmatimonadales bacterium]|nr:VWA domain-containing protein [Gemmatimonadales bacterium]
MAFDAPLVLALAPVIGFLVWIGATWARRERLRRAARWSAETARQARGAGRFGPTGITLAAFLGVVALAGPRWGNERIETETRGLNLVVAVDISRSMLAEDAGGGSSRLARSLREGRRLAQDLDGDRLGLVAFAGASYILSPLSVDGSALMLYLDALDPDVASEGGTSLAPGLAMGGELLAAEPGAADRVLVVFTDGEAHDSMSTVLRIAQQLKEAGVHLILVAEGGRDPVRIPLRDDQGAIQGYQSDDEGQVVETSRMDDVLGATANAAQGTIVAADLPDQAGAVRDLVASYKRNPATETNTQQGMPRGWIPLVLAIAILLSQSFSRRTAALVGVFLALGLAGVQEASAQQPTPSRRRTLAELYWDLGDSTRASDAYLGEVNARNGDTAWFNAGTAAMAARDFSTARNALARAATSLDPDIRFRALYNEGLLALRAAEMDTIHRDAHLGEAERAYREALLLRPLDGAAKWNLELAQRRRRQGGGGQSQSQPQNQNQNQQQQRQQPPPTPQGMTEAQADEILRSIGQEELKTRRERMGRARRAAEPGVKDW